MRMSNFTQWAFIESIMRAGKFGLLVNNPNGFSLLSGCDKKS